MPCGGFTCSKNALAALNILYILVSFILIGVAAYGRIMAIVTSIAIIGGIIACGVFLFLVALVGLVGAVKHHQVLLFFYMIILFLVFLLQFAISCACLALDANARRQLLISGWRSSSNKTKGEAQNQFDCCGLWAVNDTDPKLGHPPCHSYMIILFLVFLLQFAISCACLALDARSRQQILVTGWVSSTNQTKAEAQYQFNCCGLWTQNETDAKLGHPSCEDLGCCEETTDSKCTKCPTCMSVIEPMMGTALRFSGGVGLFFSFTELLGVWLAVRYRNQKDPRANPSAFL